ncbi:hypothetical protein [uncultured Chitinophaga sp.]|uniref:hypothetical protein n=1 Tax=uncultured Chitinophaga sp. TaxID=339340 RepID=UPI002609619C|nr:hypothetical protein [uncultured Chitinophaga sp.]
MEKILALNNIQTVGFIDASNVERKYAFTSKMAASSVFIEYFTIDEFAVEVEDDEEEGEEDFNDDVESPEHGSSLSVIMKNKGKYYEFLMYHNTFEIGVPVILVQTIIFLVKLIEESGPDQLVEYLTSLATDPLIPHEIADREFKNVALKMLKVKIQTIEDLIHKSKSSLN